MGIFNNSKIGWFIMLFSFAVILSCNNEKTRNEISFLLPEGSECCEIINADSLALNSSYLYRAYFDGHPAIIANNYLTVIDDTLYSPIQLPFDYNISDIHWVESDCFFSADSTIFYGEEDGTAYPLIATDRTIDFFCVSTNRILFPVDSSIVEYDFEAKKVTPLVQVQNTINHLEIVSSSVFFSAGNNLYLYYSNVLYHLYCTDAKILSFEIHPTGGIFLGTEKGLFFLTPEYKKVHIVSIPIRDLTLIGDDLFVIFKDNSSVMLTNVSQFNNLL